MNQQSKHLSDLNVLVRGGDQMTVQQIKNKESYTITMSALPMMTLIQQAGAVIGCSVNQELINVGSNVQFSAGPNEVINYTYANLNLVL